MLNKDNIILIISTVFLVYLSYFGYNWYKQNHPKVSVVLPIYNGEKDIPQTIPYLLASEFEDFEFIIVDDCSTDDTWKILQEFAQKDPRIRIFHNEKNLGISKTRNRGIELSRGKYLAMMDHDDISLPQRLKASVEYLDQHPDTDILDVGTILKQSYDKGIRQDRVHILDYVLSNKNKSTDLYTEDEKDENIKIALMYSLAVPTQSASMLRKDFLDNHHLRYREDIVGSDDYYLYVDMAKAGAKFHHIPEVLHIYNDTPHHTQKFNSVQYWETQRAKALLYDWVGLDHARYFPLEQQLSPDEFICILLKDLIPANQKTQKFSDTLLKKNYRLLCSDEQENRP